MRAPHPCTAVLLLVAGGTAVAAPPEGAPRLGHYVSADGQVGLVLDRSGAVPLLRLDGTPEIWALRSETSGPNTKLARDDGYVLITVGQWADHQLWVEGRMDAVSVKRDADAPPISVGDVTKAGLDERLVAAGRQVKASTGAKVRFVLGGGLTTDKARGLAASVIDNAVLALGRAGSEELGKTVSAVQQVIISAGAKPEVTVAKKTVRIDLELAKELAGRPSSARIQQAIEAAL